MKDSLVVALLLWTLATTGTACADILIDNGLVTDIDYEVAEVVFVRDAADGGISRISVLPGAAFVSAVTLEEHSGLDMSGGEFRDDLSLAGDSSASITGGTVRGFYPSGDSTTTIAGNAEIVHCIATGNASVTIEGGAAIGSLNTLGARSIRIRGGDIRGLFASGFPRVDISGGVFRDQIYFATATASISGGRFETPVLLAGDVEISGGQFVDGVELTGPDASLTYVGSGFAVNGIAVDDSQSSNFGLTESTWYGNPCLTGVVTGTLADGTPLNQTIHVLGIDGYGEVHFIPEPASLWLVLAAGGWLIRKRRVGRW